ncbi:MAG: hydrogenase 3 maturation endopeptidase HyCI, partial [Candidatus Omnitrophica bacterium]|nr:hydrogenase 3 maturation endopeptidase HyCI [Candidatus Omnitrophota bacterium]
MSPLLNKLEKILKGKILLLGIGNTLRGDDAFGLTLANRLRDKVAFKVFEVGVAVENFLGAIIKEKPDTVLFVDAV